MVLVPSFHADGSSQNSRSWYFILPVELNTNWTDANKNTNRLIISNHLLNQWCPSSLYYSSIYIYIYYCVHESCPKHVPIGLIVHYIGRRIKRNWLLNSIVTIVTSLPNVFIFIMWTALNHKPNQKVLLLILHSKHGSGKHCYCLR